MCMFNNLKINMYLDNSSCEANIPCNAFKDSSGGVGVQAVTLVQHFQLFWSDGGSLTLIPSVLLLNVPWASLNFKGVL